MQKKVGHSLNDLMSWILRKQKLSQDSPKVGAHEDLAIAYVKTTHPSKEECSDHE